MRLNSLRSFRFLLPLLLIALVLGCGGGGGGGGSATKTAAFKVRIEWGARSRTVGLSSALSARVTLANAAVDGGNIVWTVNRPVTAAGSPIAQVYDAPTSATLGSHNLGVTFYAQANAGGDAVGTAGAVASIAETGTNELTLSTYAGVDAVRVLPSQSVKVGETKELLIEAKNASGTVVALSTGSAFFTVTSGTASLETVNDGSSVRGKAPSTSAEVTVRVDQSTSAAAVVKVTSDTTVTVSPESGTLGSEFTLDLSAVVGGAPETGVQFAVEGGAANGTLESVATNSATYVAPKVTGATSRVCKVIVTSNYDTSVNKTISVTVEPRVSVALMPTNPTATRNGTVGLSATVSNLSPRVPTGARGVTWRVLDDGSGQPVGTISTAGVYTAPNRDGTFTVEATSVYDTTKKATVGVVVSTDPSDLVDTGLGEIAQTGWTIRRATQIQPKKKWTVIVFMNFANDLESYGIQNMNQMEKVGSTADVNVVVQFKRIAGRYDNSNGDWGDTRRFYVRKDSDASTINSTLLSQNSNVDMGNPNELQSYINWAVRTFPADHYNLVIGNHGAGWRSVKTRSQKSPLTRGVSYDDTTGKHIDTIQFPAAVVHPEGKKWDLITMDCSLMQMVEVLYEWRDTANYIVGSEESPPGEGYAYDTTLQKLVSTPSLTGRQLGINYAQDTSDRYTGRYDITQSVVDTSLMGAIVPSLNDLGNTLNSLVATRGADISLARADAQSYEYPENKDLLHFLDRLDLRISNPTLQTKTAAVRNAAKAAVIFNATTGVYNPSSQGLAAFLPRPSQYTQIDIQQTNGFGQNFSRLKIAIDAPAWQTFLANGPP